MPARYHQSKIATSLFTAMLLSVGSGNAEAQTENADSLVKQAISEAKQQKHIDAIRNYSRAINLSPEHHPAYFYRARSRKALADYQNAVLDYNFAIKLNPKSSLAYTERGWCLTKLDLPKRAMNDLDQALKLNPKNTRALEYRASLKYKQGDFQGALGDVNQILKLKPNSSKQLAEFMLPRLNLVKKKNSSNESQSSVATSVESPRNFDINIDTTGSSSVKIDKKELAQVNNEAAEAIKKGKFDQAVKLLQPITEKHPDYEFARKNLTIAYNNYGLKLARHNTRDSAEKFRSALYFSPGEATARRNLNAVIKELGKDPNSYEDRVELGNEQLRAGAPRMAFVEFTEALRLRNTPSVRRKLAEVCLQLENNQNKDIPEDSGTEKRSATTNQMVASAPTDSAAPGSPQTQESVPTQALEAKQDTEQASAGAADPIQNIEAKQETASNPVAQDTIDEKTSIESANQEPPETKSVEPAKSMEPAKSVEPTAPLIGLGLPAPGNLNSAPVIKLSSSDLLLEWENRMRNGQERYDQGDYIAAENDFDSAVSLAERIGPDSRELAMSLQRLAEVYLIHKRVAQANSLLARALVILSRHYSVESPILVKLREKIDTLSGALNREVSHSSDQVQAQKQGPNQDEPEKTTTGARPSIATND